jgi:hypothetical protein
MASMRTVLGDWKKVVLCAVFVVVAGGIAILRHYAAPLPAAQRLTLSGAAPPKAVFDRLEFDLGIVDSLATYRHTFLVKNAGGLPLELARGPAVCKCTKTELPEKPIPPGGQAELVIWMVNRGDTGPFTLHPTILTNDPQQPIVTLKVRGTSRGYLAAEPREVSLTVEPPDNKRTATTMVFSQYWEKFQLRVKKTSLQGIKCRMEPAGKAHVGALEALSAYRAEITLPADMPDGPFTHWITLSGQPAGSAEPPREIQVELKGRVNGRVTIHGAKVDTNQVLHLGPIGVKQDLRESLIVKVHDDRRILTVRKIETAPGFLHARLLSPDDHLAKIGVYRLEVAIPAGAPVCDYMGRRAAVVRLYTDHPKLPVIELKVEFTIVEI